MTDHSAPGGGIFSRAWAALTAWLQWLTAPARRRIVHQVVTIAAGAGVIVGLWSQQAAQSWVLVAVAAGTLLSSVTAAIVTHRGDMRVLYGGGAALVAALTTAGALDGGTAERVMLILALISGTVTGGVATARTDPATPTGEPAVEYEARVGDAAGSGGLDTPPPLGDGEGELS